MVAPLKLATATCGLDPIFGKCEALGLVPPMAGCEWQLPQLFELYRGPKPSCGCMGRFPPIERAAMKVAIPAANVADCPALRPGNGAPASIVSPRTPGSTAFAP